MAQQRKLTPDQVRELRRDWAALVGVDKKGSPRIPYGKTAPLVAKYGVPAAAMHQIINGWSYREVV